MQQQKIEAAAEIVGDTPIVRVTLHQGDTVVSIPVEVESGKFEEAARKGIAFAKEVGFPSSSEARPSAARVSEKRPAEVKPAFESTDEKPADKNEFPEPGAQKWRAKESGKSPMKAPVTSKPAKGKKGKVDPGLIEVLKDACEAERVDYKQPRSNQEAQTWIVQLREEGIRTLEEVDDG